MRGTQGICLRFEACCIRVRWQKELNLRAVAARQLPRGFYVFEASLRAFQQIHRAVQYLKGNFPKFPRHIQTSKLDKEERSSGGRSFVVSGLEADLNGIETELDKERKCCCEQRREKLLKFQEEKTEFHGKEQLRSILSAVSSELQVCDKLFVKEYCYSFLCIFFLCSFVKGSKDLVAKQKFVLFVIYCNKYSILDILYLFTLLQTFLHFQISHKCVKFHDSIIDNFNLLIQRNPNA